MTLPPEFQFSQGSLGDFAACRRRFQLRYLQEVAWPALKTEPALENEARMQRGAAFHRLVRQHSLGVPVERLAALAGGDPELEGWWVNYLSSALVPPGGRRFPEVGLVGQVAGHRLVARYDLIVAGDDSHMTIFDWKTNKSLPKREWLEASLQTRVYPFLLVQAGDHLNGGEAISPELVEMVYWFANHPDHPQRFPYGPAQFEEDRDYLAGLIEEIASLGDDQFPLTDQEERCRYCPYRSLCNRGVEAGDIQEVEAELDSAADPDLDLDFDQIAEIEF